MVLLSRAAVALEYSLISSKTGMRAVPSGEGEAGGVSQNTCVVLRTGRGDKRQRKARNKFGN